MRALDPEGPKMDHSISRDTTVAERNGEGGREGSGTEPTIMYLY